MSDYVDGDVIFDTQFLALKRAIEGNGILSGLAGSPGPGALQTQWAAGTFYANFTKVVIASPGTFSHSAGDPTNDRWDLIYGTAAGLFKTEGAPAAAPQMPDLPASSIIIGLVYIPATTVTITAGMIRDFAFKTPLQDHIQDTTIHYTKPIAEADVTFQNGGHAHAGGASGQKVTYANLLSIPSTFNPSAHALGSGTYHTSATIAQLNALISDAVLIDTGDSRLSDARTPLSHDHTKHTDVLRIIPFDVFNAHADDSEVDPVKSQQSMGGQQLGVREFPTGADTPGPSPGGGVYPYVWMTSGIPPGNIYDVTNQKVVIVYVATAGSGNVKIPYLFRGMKPGSFTDLRSTSVQSITANGLPQEIEIPFSKDLSTYTSVQIGINREGTDASDTFTGMLYIIAVYLRIKMNQ